MHDLKFALRRLRKSPGFTFVAILTLALGIGANVAIFSVVNTVLVRPFAFSQLDRLVWISSQLPTNPRAPFSLPEFCDYRDQSTLFDGLGAVGSYNANLVDSDGCSAARVNCFMKMIAYSLSSVVSFTSRGACLSTSFEYPWHFAVSHLTPNLLCICVL
jgi:hypothetical protein